jgi:ribose transport system ATP-binding protein
MTAPARIRFSHVTKRFFAVTALDDVSFDVRPGELLALCGENGAGKSTLMKILSGVISDYDGTIELDGESVRFTGTRDAERHGVSIIHQELNLVGDLTAAANIFLWRELTKLGVWLDDAAMRSQAAELFAQLDCAIRPDDLIRTLRIGDQQLVEIAKALALRARILIMDEPTSALTESEVARLYRIIGKLREQGVTIIYISHKMDEVFRLADRITVLRDGKVIQTLDRTAASPKEITRLMVGREINTAGFRTPQPAGEEVARVENLSLPWPGHARGLMGAGRTELLECLYGSSAEPPQGQILLRGQRVSFADPQAALQAGVAMVTEDRKRYGVIASMNVREHITLSSLDHTSTAGLIQFGREADASHESIGQLRIKTAGGEAAITSLSGGNQQKCLIARALRTNPVLLLLDDPTRGIDVGAKAEIYRLIDELCQQGLAIIITSSELPELLTVCDRIVVLCEGRQTGEFRREEFTEAALMEAATGNV